jgi:hypothetical protein
MSETRVHYFAEEAQTQAKNELKRLRTDLLTVMTGHDQIRSLYRKWSYENWRSKMLAFAVMPLALAVVRFIVRFERMTLDSLVAKHGNPEDPNNSLSAYRNFTAAARLERPRIKELLSTVNDFVEKSAEVA